MYLSTQLVSLWFACRFRNTHTFMHALTHARSHTHTRTGDTKTHIAHNADLETHTHIHTHTHAHTEDTETRTHTQNISWLIRVIADPTNWNAVIVYYLVLKHNVIHTYIWNIACTLQDEWERIEHSTFTQLFLYLVCSNDDFSYRHHGIADKYMYTLCVWYK